MLKLTKNKPKAYSEYIQTIKN